MSNDVSVYPQQQAEDVDTQETANAVRAFVRFARIVKHRKIYVLAALAVSCGLGLFYYLTTEPLYEANSSVLVISSGEEVWQPGMSSERSQQAQIPTYVELLTSSVVLEGAIADLMGKSRDLRVDFDSGPRDEWAQKIRNNLSARAVRMTNIIEIGYQSKQPRAAEAVVNAVLNSYLNFMERNHKSVAQEIVAILEKNRQDLVEEISQKQTELVALQGKVADLGHRESRAFIHPTVQAVVTLNESLLTMREERIKLQASLAGIENALRAGGDLRPHLVKVEPVIGRELMLSALGMNASDVETLNQLNRKLLEDRAKLQELQEFYGPRSHHITSLQGSIQETQYYINEMRNYEQRVNSMGGTSVGPMIAKMIREQLSNAWEHETKLVEQYKIAKEEALKLTDDMAQLAFLEHDLNRLRSLHDGIHDKISSIDISKGQSNVRVAVVSEPKAKDQPVSPKLAVVGLLSILGGFAVGIALVYVVDVLDDRFRSPEELQLQLGLPLLAMIRKLGNANQHGADAVQVHTNPRSVESEAFRTLRTALSFAGEDIERIAVTSTEPGDGKTTVISNLATSFAQAGKRTLLIDADLRRPGLTKLFELRGKPGLSDVLRESDDLGQMCLERIEPTGIHNLEVLPCGPKPINPAELLDSERMNRLLEWAEANYDQILVDCPPALAASDAAIVGRLTEVMLMVVHPSKNHRRLVTRAVESLVSVGVTLTGIVANRVDDGKDGEYYGYGAGYGYGYGYSSYGHDDEDEHGGEQPDGHALQKVATGESGQATAVRRRAA